MLNNTSPTAPTGYARYLGLSVRSDGFGFVVIEDTFALDCGVRACERAQSNDCLAQQFERILKMYIPTEVIILAPGLVEATAKKGGALKTIAERAKKKRISVVRPKAGSVTEYFRQLNAETKYEIALAVAKILPELAWRLPPKRKAWQSERRRTWIFEAAAAVIAHAKL
jgi:hypothetical protein